MLLHWGAEIDARNSGGSTPLAVAENEDEKLPEVVNILILNGAQLYVRGIDGDALSYQTSFYLSVGGGRRVSRETLSRRCGT